MHTDAIHYAYGPVPSRRLGRSLGINHIPSKICSYSCIYCQVGRTTRIQVERTPFYSMDKILFELEKKILLAREAAKKIDYISLVPDGEPTLDANLGQLIDHIKCFGIPVAVISNSSLIWREDVQQDLLKADWVSLKVDTVDEALWRKVNRPHRSLALDSILKGVETFAHRFSGILASETLIVGGINDGDESLHAVAVFLKRVKPKISYISVPMRPPAEVTIHIPEEKILASAYRIFASQLPHVEFLVDFEGDDFTCYGDIESDLLSTMAVHPMRKDSVEAMLANAGATWDVVAALVARGDLVELDHAGHVFYLRRFTHPCKLYPGNT